MSIKTRPTSSVRPSSRNPRSQLIMGAIIVAVVVVALIVIVISSNSTNAGNLARFASIPQSRTSDGAFVLGSGDAPIKIIEFVDYTCPVCLTFKPDIDRFIDEYVTTGKAQYEFRALETHGGLTTGYAMQLAECAEEQRKGAFWEASEVLFEYGAKGTSAYNGNMGIPLAERIGLDKSKLLSCVRTANQINVDMAYAQRLGINSTPTVLVKIGTAQPVALPGSRSFETIARLVEAAQGS